MEFTKLRLAGFKSFVDPADVLIENGLTGVVGPNGCGKSNLVEALRWVMGEASVKSVRGSAMDDVIFAGSGRRPQRDTAEVTLFLDNRARRAPVGFNDADDLEVTRRITRGLGSDYRINGKSARARDVQILFADAASGSRSPSMVRQGQVAELIAAKPSERRHILEEAAGVAGLRARRHEALLRLKAAEDNLSRVDDVAEEVSRQLAALQRQAKQARRYKALSDEIATLEASVHHLRWHDARQALAAAERAVSDAATALAEASEVQTRAAVEEAAAGHATPATRDAEAAAGAARQKLASELAALEARETALREKLAAALKAVEALERDLSRHAATKADAAEATRRLRAEAADLARANEGADARIAALAAAATEAAGRAETAEADATSAANEAATIAASWNAADTALKASERRVRAAQDELAKLSAALAAARADDALAARDAAAAALAAANRAETGAAAARQDADATLQRARAAETQAADRAAALKAEVRNLETEAGGLKRLLRADPGKGAAVLDACRVAPGLEAAFAAALGDDLSAPVADAGAPVRWTVNPGTDALLPAGAEPLSAAVEAPDALLRRLAQVGVVDEADGPRLIGALHAGQRLVSRSGALWRWDGFCRSAGAPSAAAERLAQKNRLAAVEAALADRAPALAQASGTHERLAAERVAAQRASTDADTAVAAARKTAEAARRAFDATDAKARRSEAETTRLEALTAAAESQHGAAVAEHEAALAAIRTVADPAAAQQARDTARAAATAAHARARDSANAHDNERRAAAGRTKRLERVRSELSDWDQRAANADRTEADLTARLDTVRAEAAALKDKPGESEEARFALAGRLKRAEAAERDARDTRVAAEARERTAKEAARQSLDGLSAAREASARADERATAARARLAEVVAALTDALDCPPAAAAGKAKLDPAAPLPDRAATESRLERLRGERERLGSVNLCAEDELAALQDRHGTMIAERDDLLAAIAKLRDGVGELNREARQRLTAAFKTVDAEFQRLFTHLFGGGAAHLTLTDADDPLEAGLDIVARPPGKKPQALSLLSGGEQTLTATALIFAVFLTNPAPICVLDEIDAPLDDANVERFCNLLDAMTEATATRFLIITHNPITMARMDRLYGVTMVERGVSQLVSVNLAEAEVLRESA